MGPVKALASFFEGLSNGKSEPAQKMTVYPKKPSLNQPLNKDQRQNSSLLGMVYSTLPGLFTKTSRQLENTNHSPDTGQANTVQPSATEYQYQTDQRPKGEALSNEDVSNSRLADKGPSLGSNRNIAYLVGAYHNHETEKRQETTPAKFNPTDECSSNGTHRLRKKTTSTSSSGFYTGSATDRSSFAGEILKDDKEWCSTKRYVETIPCNEHGPRFKKCSSEPTVLQPMKQRTLTQENVFNIKGSNVSIHKNESMTASQLSVFSSSEQEIRDSIAAHTSDSLEEHRKCLRVPDQRRLKKARKIFEEEGIVIVIGNQGSGSTNVAWELLSEAKSKEKYHLIEVSNFEKCIHSKESVTILVDDAFGETKLQEDALDTCLKYVKLCKRKRSTKNVKMIFTVKHHIANQCKRQLEDFRKCIVDIEDPKIQLDSDEMLEISLAIFDNYKEEMKVKLVKGDKDQSARRKGWQNIPETLLSEIAESALPSGFPKKFKQFLDSRENIRQGLRFFTHPREDLLEDLIFMKQSINQEDHDKYLTLVMIAVCGEKLRLEDVAEIDESRSRSISAPIHKKTKKTKKRAKSKAKMCEIEVPWWIEIVIFYAKQSSKSLSESFKTGISLLRNTYIKEEMKGVYIFAAPCVKNATLLTIGEDFPQHILKLSDIQFFKEYIRPNTPTYFGDDGEKCVDIDVSDKLLCSEANEKLMKLFETGDMESFANHKMFRNEPFTIQFLDSLSKTTDWLQSFITISSKENGRCALDGPKTFFTRQNNLAKSIIFHKAWSEKRKVQCKWTTQKEQEIISQCCKYGDEDIYFELRRRYKVDANYSCLQLAIKCGSYIIAEDILESISQDITDEQKCECMEVALFKFAEQPKKKRCKVIDVLQKYVPVDYKITGVDPAIHAAAKDDNGSVIVALEYFGGDINVTNEHGKTILHEAVQNKNRAAFLDIALRYGADQRKADKLGVLPIHEGARLNKPYVLRLLMKADCEIAYAKDNSGRQPLHYAAIYNCFKAANCLILHGADVDAIDDRRRTPLHYAAESGKGAVIHSLLEANADTSKKDKDGQSPWIIVCKSKNIEGIKRLLRDDSIDVNVPIDNMFPIHQVAATGNVNLFQKLLNKRANIKEVTFDTNDTVLHIAIKYGHDKLVEKILEINDELIGYKNKRNEVPLHTAAQYGNFFAANALLRAGADRSLINKQFQKPVCLAMQKLKMQINEEERVKYCSVYRLLDGHKVRRETAV